MSRKKSTSATIDPTEPNEPTPAGVDDEVGVMADVESVTLESGGRSVTVTGKQFSKLTAVVSEDQKATLRALLDDLRIMRIDEAAEADNLKAARKRTAEAQEALNSYAAEICDPQEQLGFQAAESQ